MFSYDWLWWGALINGYYVHNLTRGHRGIMCTTWLGGHKDTIYGSFSFKDYYYRRHVSVGRLCFYFVSLFTSRVRGNIWGLLPPHPPEANPVVGDVGGTPLPDTQEDFLVFTIITHTSQQVTFFHFMIFSLVS